VKGLEVQSHPWTEWSRWSPVWSQLHEGAAEASLFLTTDWVETWLEVFGAALQSRILVFSEGDPKESRVVGICLLSIQTQWAGPIRVRRAYLNTSGELEADEVCSEDNALLCRPGAEDAVASALAAHLQTQDWASLHNASWNARGKTGVFGSPVYRDFHERLIRRLLPSRRVALLEIATGDLKLAVLYNFVYAGASLFYQSGQHRDPDKRVKVGLVAHASAIEHCRAAGLARYDFLASDHQYKKSLASASRPQSWLVFRKRNAKLETLNLLRKANRALRGQRHRD